jgi:hypothetical protein
MDKCGVIISKFLLRKFLIYRPIWNLYSFAAITKILFEANKWPIHDTAKDHNLL